MNCRSGQRTRWFESSKPKLSWRRGRGKRWTMIKRAAAAQGLPLLSGAIVSGLSLAFFDLLLGILWGRYPFEGFDFVKYSAPSLGTVVLELATTSVCFFLFFATMARLHFPTAKKGVTGRSAILVFYLCLSFLAVLTDVTNEALLLVVMAALAMVASATTQTTTASPRP